MNDAPSEAWARPDLALRPAQVPAFVRALSPPPGVRSGIDVVQISRVRESIAAFGERFAARLFTPREIAYAGAQAELAPERYAARFAAKEAAIKAFGLSHVGVDWRDIEVVREADGRCRLSLNGRARLCAGLIDECDISLSLSHDGDYAVAIVVVAPFAGRQSTEFTSNNH